MFTSHVSLWSKITQSLPYHKYSGENWPESEFNKQQVQLVSGNIVDIKLAERGTFLGGKLWIREFHKLTQSGHQTSLISTDYRRDMATMAATMFARWFHKKTFSVTVHRGILQQQAKHERNRQLTGGERSGNNRFRKEGRQRLVAK